MATKPKKQAAEVVVDETTPAFNVPAETTTGTAVSTWEDEMAREAAVAAKMEQNAGGGQFFSIKGGILSFADAQIPNNQMAVIILDSMLENVFYTEDYDPENPAGPTCFAFGRDEQEMVPHEVVFANGTQQSEKCQTCQWNQWGTADKGKGKACKNGRRIALLGAGTLDANGAFTLDEKLESYKSGIVGFLRVPVTSVKGYAVYVKQVANVIKRPPYGVITKVRVMPDPKTQLRVTFEMLGKVPDNLMPAVMERNREVKGMIDFPYQVGGTEEEAPSPKRQVRTPAKAAKAGKAVARGGARAAKY
jgi:hypothetical protein